MKKILLSFIFLLLFVPVLVNAETCDTSKVTIESISLDQTNNVNVIEDATAHDKNINLNLGMSKVGDNIKYKIVVKNNSNEDFLLDKNSINISSEYIDYSIESSDNSNIIKKKTSKTVFLNVQYKKQVPDSAYEDGVFNDNVTMKVNLSSNNSSSNNIINPNTGIKYLLIILLIGSICLISTIIFKKKKSSIITILLISVIIPISVNALCKIDITINSKVKIREVYACTYEGELVQGAEFTNGDYVYRYMQEGTGGGWTNITEDGWGIKAVNNGQNSITSKICTTINDKPIVSASHMFFNRQTLETVDLSSFESSHVNNMEYMFYFCFKLKNLNLKNLDTSNVTNLNYAFSMLGTNSSEIDLDLSEFNTSKVTSMKYTFDRTGSGSERVKLNVSNWDTSNVTSVTSLFSSFAANASSVEIIGLEDWNTSKIEQASGMFHGAAKNAQRFKIDLSNWDVTNFNSFHQMFDGAGENAEIWGVGDLSNWNTNNAYGFQNMFINAGKNANNWQSIGTLNINSTPFSNIFENVKNAKATININEEPASATNYQNAFKNAATGENGNIIVNYKSSVTSINRIINTKSTDSKVFKGELLD